AAADSTAAAPAATERLDAVWAMRACERASFGEPVAITLDFGGTVYVADASPPRLVSYAEESQRCIEFQTPEDSPAFRPSDVAVRGFFVYAVDEPDRALLRWDASGSWRDVLVNFEDLDTPGRRISPFGLDVDAATGRVAVTDVENHQILVLDTYLEVDVAFGHYGAHPGQLDTPQGVSFTPRGELLVADTRNARVQFFSDAGTFRRAVPAGSADSPLRQPRNAVAGEDGRIWVADPAAGHVFEFAPDGALVRSLVPSASARFEPTDVAVTRNGRLYVTDAATQTLYAFVISPTEEP
ncbi:MAG TPA: NHL repeat-containing protein, partial [Candidatus Krumholzibacteria bacterium]|nr:NHL repeat-containing protein [Candidatus Krumholzibacteria bacterium]